MEELLWSAAKFLFFIAFIAICLTIILAFRTSAKYAYHERTEKEKLYYDPEKESLQKLPSLFDAATIDLTVVIPAYDEQQRLPPMLDECLTFLESRQKSRQGYKYEVILVDDGSTDGTSKVGLTYSTKFGVDKVRVLTLERNRGKGGAVTLGMLSGRGKYLLFADADGATTFADLEKLENNILEISGDPELDVAITVGSRAHLEAESIAKRSFFRTVLMLAFHFLVWCFCVRSVADTQCGFKLFTRRTAKKCFPNLHVKRWAFDVELLYIGECLKIPIREVAVQWVEIDGSKIVPVWSWLQMGKDLILIWMRYTLGAWKIRQDDKKDD